MKQLRIWFPLFCIVFVVVALPQRGFSQADPSRLQLAQMLQDVQMLKQEMQRMKLQMAQVESKNLELAKALEAQQKYLVDMRANIVTLNELQAQVGAVRRETLEELQKSQKSLGEQVNRQIETLGKRTDQALAQMAKTIGQAPRIENTRPMEDYPRTGVEHTVAGGETLTGIASRYGARINHIRSANNITNDRSLQVGQVLFIPIQAN